VYRSVRVLLLIVVSILAIIPPVRAFSETIPLSVSSALDDHSVTKTVELNQGERITGNFTFSNIPVFKAGGASNMTYAHLIYFYNPKGDTIFTYFDIDHASFDYIALYSGVYKFWINLEQTSVYRDPAEIAKAEITLNYNTAGPMPVPTQNGQSMFLSYLIVSIIAVIVVVGCFIAAYHFYHKEKRGATGTISIFAI